MFLKNDEKRRRKRKIIEKQFLKENSIVKLKYQMQNRNTLISKDHRLSKIMFFDKGAFNEMKQFQAAKHSSRVNKIATSIEKG